MWGLLGKGGACERSACWVKEIHVCLDVIILVKGCLLVGAVRKAQVRRPESAQKRSTSNAVLTAHSSPHEGC